MKLIDNSKYRLKSGREFYAHQGIVGLSPSDKYCGVVFHGYDGTVYEAALPGSRSYEEHEDDSPMTPDERRELADFMIALWTTYRDVAIKEQDR